MKKPREHEPVPPIPGRPADVTIRDPRAWGRETVESIVVAFTLALLFRGFEAEAFVIPTGSMANTLMGRHKDLACADCGREYRVGCSREFDEATGRVRPHDMVAESRCPNCGSLLPLLSPRDPLAYDPRYPSFSGDRILVDKSAYDFSAPRRWDVVVFKYPEDAKTNYIKRLVGLPGETVSIAGGDLWTTRGDGDPVIARKPPRTLEAMLQCVHDSRQVPQSLVQAGWPSSWSDWSPSGSQPACRWTSSADGRSHDLSAPPAAAATLRYRHLVAGPEAWEALAAGRPIERFATPALIGDFQPYNAGPEFVGLHVDRELGVPVDGSHWVGDIALECRLENRAESGTLTLDLVKGGLEHFGMIDLATGRLTLSRSGDAQTATVTADTPVRGRGSWRLLFANVDDELSLTVDGRRVACSGPAAWVRPISDARVRPVLRGARPGDPAAGDLAPVGITATAADVGVSDLRVLRDVYYIASGDKAAMEGSRPESPRKDYALGADQFFMLGDNSSASKDGRAWGSPAEPLHHVDRRLLVGRAMVVFWPHAVPAPWSIPVKIGAVEVRLPSWPNLGRMRFIR